ncbi:MAG TPA: choice-of-anchor Q domain-containing protein [Rhodanobacteraceae bacterium]|nr:choice-of-anchor Q domain-containing protein [Rhodanobacteraceae bacterium]
MGSKSYRARQPLALAVAVALGIGGAHAGTVTVTNPGDTSTSTSCTLRQAIESANTDSLVGGCASAGFLGGPDTIDFDPSLANQTIVLTGAPLSTIQTLTLNGSGQTIDAGGISGVFFVRDTATLTASSLTLTGGSAANGGGIYTMEYANLDLTNVTISGNSASGNGGGIDLGAHAKLQLNDSTVTGNSATNQGGGIYALGSATIGIVGSTISNGSANLGGGIYATSGDSLVIAGSRVNDNSSTLAGGGIALSGVTATISNSAISGNTTSAGGGGLDAESSSTVSISESTISGNSANTGGGIYAYDHSTITLANSTVSGNNASSKGGGVFADKYCSLTMSNSTIGGNYSAGPSGGIGSDNAITITDSTISGNTADKGGGVYTLGNDASELVDLRNTIVSGNTATTGADLYAFSINYVTAGYSLLGTALQTDLAGNGNIFSDSPGLGPLTGNGGPTQTMLPQGGSPAIDAGNNALVPASTDYDQRGTGYARIVNGTVDIGAVEAQQVQFPLGVTVAGSGRVDAAGTPAPLSGAIADCTASGGSCSAWYAPPEAVSLTATPATGWHFVQWADDCSGTAASTSVTMDAAKSCSASFAINNHSVGGTVSGLAAGNSVVLQDNGGDDLSVSANGAFQFSTSVDYGSSYAVTVLTQPDSPAQTCTVANGTGTMPDADVTNVQVTCSTETHTVTGSVPAGHGTLSPMSQVITDGAQATLTVTPDVGYHAGSVAGCGGSLSGTIFTTAAVTADCTVTAAFAADSYAIGASVSGGHGSISPPSVMAEFGSTVVFTVTPDPNYEIDSVTGCGGTLTGTTFTTAPIQGACSVSATFAQIIQPSVPVPMLDWRWLLALAGLLGTLSTAFLRRR